MYEEAFFLTKKRGNNAFSYELRGARPRLFVPSLEEGSLEDVRLGAHVVFEGVDENGILQSCKGLGHFVRTAWQGVPMLIFDNHNHAFYFWFEAWKNGLIQKGATLIHVDQHKDMRMPEGPFAGESLEDAFRYTNEVLNVGNYIVPAKEFGLVEKIQFVTSEEALKDRSFMVRGNKILNIDLDFFAPELAYIDFEEARKFILDHARGARLITVATSPFFIEQTRAIKFLNELFSS